MLKCLEEGRLDELCGGLNAAGGGKKFRQVELLKPILRRPVPPAADEQGLASPRLRNPRHSKRCGLQGRVTGVRQRASD